MRAKIVGRMSLDALIREVAYFADCLRECGVEQVEGVNLYVNLRLDGRPVNLLSDDGAIVDTVTLRGAAAYVYTRTDLTSLSVKLQASDIGRSGADPTGNASQV